jgi:hypothetical protein
MASDASWSMRCEVSTTFPVDASGQGGLGESGADRSGDVGDGDGGAELLDATVGQCDLRHGGLQKTKKCGRAALF